MSDEATGKVLMLGMGWFPDQLGGLNRYFRGLLEATSEAEAVVVGPAVAAGRVHAASRHGAPLPVRLVGYAATALRHGCDAEVIDAHFALYALLPSLLPPLRRKPWMVHFQGPWEAEVTAATGHAGFDSVVRRGIERSVYSHASVVVTLSSAFRQIVVERYRVSPWKVRVIRPGLHPHQHGDRHAGRERLGFSTEEFVVCCVRRLTPRMGHQVLLAGWPVVIQAVPQARLVIAGDGELASAIRAQVTGLELTESVCLLGPISDEDLTGLYLAADVNVVPSVALEGFGLTVLEAAGHGTPSIVTRVGGLPEAVHGLGSSLIVEPGSAGELASRLISAARGELPTREATVMWAAEQTWDAVAERHRSLRASLSRQRASDVPSGQLEPRRLRVVYLDHVAKLSGGELALLRLLRALGDIDAHVVLGEPGPLVARLHESGVSVEVLALPDRARNLRKGRLTTPVPLRVVVGTALYTVRLAWRLRKLRPDIVHTNSLKSGVYGALAAKLAGLPVVWHLRDRLEPDYLPRPGIALIRALTRLADVVICNSESTRAALGERENATVIPSPVEHRRAGAGRPLAGAGGALVFGMVGRLCSWKGQDVFLRAFAEAFPGGFERGVIVGAALFGEAEEEYARGLQQLAAGLGIADRVEFRGHRDDVAAELERMDVLVHASVVPEPLGQVVIEGMAAGLPVIAARAGGPSEVITDGVDGLLYAPGDTSDLAGAMRRLARDPSLRSRLAYQGQKRAEAYAPERCAELTMRAYAGVARARRVAGDLRA